MCPPISRPPSQLRAPVHTEQPIKGVSKRGPTFPLPLPTLSFPPSLPPPLPQTRGQVQGGGARPQGRDREPFSARPPGRAIPSCSLARSLARSLSPPPARTPQQRCRIVCLDRRCDAPLSLSTSLSLSLHLLRLALSCAVWHTLAIPPLRQRVEKSEECGFL